MKNRTTIKISIFISVLILLISAQMMKYYISNISKNAVEQSLTTVLQTTKQAILSWQQEEQSSAIIWASDPRILGPIRSLLESPHDKSSLVSHPAQQQLRQHFDGIISTKSYRGYFIIGPDSLSLSSTRDSNIGISNLLAQQRSILDSIFNGKSVITLPQYSDVKLSDNSTGLYDGKDPTMFVGAPIYDKGKVIAALTLRIDPEVDFTNIIRRGRIGQTGETYAFNNKGRLISESRYDDELVKKGLLEVNEKSILNVTLVDPLSNEMTYMAGKATNGISSSNMKGYPDYRGVKVVGSWLWDDNMNMGLATEIDLSEAYLPLDITLDSINIATFIVIILIIGLGYYYLKSSKTLHRALLESELSNSAKTEFLSNMSHEVRTPLHAIISFGQIASKKINNNDIPEIEKCLRNIVDDGSKLLQMLDNILDLTELSTENTQFNSDEASITTLIDGAVENNKTKINYKNIAIETNLDNPTMMISCDQQRIGQVFDHILANAIKYSPNSSLITISQKTFPYRGLVHLTISDQGPGIPVGELTTIFEPFTESSLTKTGAGGTGLGLAVCKKIILKHHGELWADNNRDGGSTFTIVLNSRGNYKNHDGL